MLPPEADFVAWAAKDKRRKPSNCKATAAAGIPGAILPPEAKHLSSLRKTDDRILATAKTQRQQLSRGALQTQKPQLSWGYPSGGGRKNTLTAKTGDSNLGTAKPQRQQLSRCDSWAGADCSPWLQRQATATGELQSHSGGIFPRVVLPPEAKILFTWTAKTGDSNLGTAKPQ